MCLGPKDRLYVEVGYDNGHMTRESTNLTICLRSFQPNRTLECSLKRTSEVLAWPLDAISQDAIYTLNPPWLGGTVFLVSRRHGFGNKEQMQEEILLFLLVILLVNLCLPFPQCYISPEQRSRDGNASTGDHSKCLLAFRLQTAACSEPHPSLFPSQVSGPWI